LLAVGFADGLIRTWDLRTWRELATLPTRFLVKGHVTSLSASPCGSFLAAGCMDGEVLVFDLHRGCRSFLISHHDDAVTVAWGSISWATPHCLACASLDSRWSYWAHGGRQLVETC
jgi:WD40 repeat protein